MTIMSLDEIRCIISTRSDERLSGIYQRVMELIGSSSFSWSDIVEIPDDLNQGLILRAETWRDRKPLL